MRSYSIFLVRLIVIVLTVLIATPRLEAQQRTSSSADSTLSLQFKDIDVSEVFRMLSERSSLNIVAESGVSGRVTLFLEDVTPSEALDIIINLNNLAYVREGNVIMVFTDQKYQSVYGRKFRDQARMKVFRFGYAPVQQASTQLASLKTKDGFLIADNRTNSLIVFDVPTALKQYANAIEVLDIPVETRVYDLDHVSVGKIRELITPFVSSSAVVLADPAANRLIVRDAPAYLAVIDDIVPEWDTPSVIITQAFELNYAIAKDVVVRLTDRLTPEVGSVEVDANTNTLIVADLPDVLADIETFLRNLDRRPYEVRIEAKILQISLDDGFNMGVNWEAVTNEFQNVTDLTTTGQFRVLGEGDDRLTITGGKLEKNNYTALIEMLATQGRTRLLSSPTLMVLNNTAARILVGSTVPD
ncbi:MAG: secretin N-terminal domain-containing protein [Candidatus Zixiibacteriota bacterium]